jgi:hypothetical protein
MHSTTWSYTSPHGWPPEASASFPGNSFCVLFWQFSQTGGSAMVAGTQAKQNIHRLQQMEMFRIERPLGSLFPTVSPFYRMLYKSLHCLAPELIEVTLIFLARFVTPNRTPMFVRFDHVFVQ